MRSSEPNTCIRTNTKDPKRSISDEEKKEAAEGRAKGAAERANASLQVLIPRDKWVITHFRGTIDLVHNLWNFLFKKYFWHTSSWKLIESFQNQLMPF